MCPVPKVPAIKGVEPNSVLEDTVLVEGIVLDKEISHPQMNKVRPGCWSVEPGCLGSASVWEEGKRW